MLTTDQHNTIVFELKRLRAISATAAQHNQRMADAGLSFRPLVLPDLGLVIHELETALCENDLALTKAAHRLGVLREFPELVAA